MEIKVINGAPHRVTPFKPTSVIVRTAPSIERMPVISNATRFVASLNSQLRTFDHESLIEFVAVFESLCAHQGFLAGPLAAIFKRRFPTVVPTLETVRIGGVEVSTEGKIDHKNGEYASRYGYDEIEKFVAAGFDSMKHPRTIPSDFTGLLKEFVTTVIHELIGSQGEFVRHSVVAFNDYGKGKTVYLPTHSDLCAEITRELIVETMRSIIESAPSIRSPQDAPRAMISISEQAKALSEQLVNRVTHFGEYIQLHVSAMRANVHRRLSDKSLLPVNNDFAKIANFLLPSYLPYNTSYAEVGLEDRVRVLEETFFDSPDWVLKRLGRYGVVTLDQFRDRYLTMFITPRTFGNEFISGVMVGRVAPHNPSSGVRLVQPDSSYIKTTIQNPRCLTVSSVRTISTPAVSEFAGFVKQTLSLSSASSSKFRAVGFIDKLEMTGDKSAEKLELKKLPLTIDEWTLLAVASAPYTFFERVLPEEGGPVDSVDDTSSETKSKPPKEKKGRSDKIVLTEDKEMIKNPFGLVSISGTTGEGEEGGDVTYLIADTGLPWSLRFQGQRSHKITIEAELGIESASGDAITRNPAIAVALFGRENFKPADFQTDKLPFESLFYEMNLERKRIVVPEFMAQEKTFVALGIVGKVNGLAKPFNVKWTNQQQVLTDELYDSLDGLYSTEKFEEQTVSVDLKLSLSAFFSIGEKLLSLYKPESAYTDYGLYSLLSMFAIVGAKNVDKKSADYTLAKESLKQITQFGEIESGDHDDLTKEVDQISARLVAGYLSTAVGFSEAHGLLNNAIAQWNRDLRTKPIDEVEEDDVTLTTPVYFTSDLSLRYATAVVAAYAKLHEVLRLNPLVHHATAKALKGEERFIHILDSVAYKVADMS